MPTPRLSFRCGDATIALDASGDVVSVVHQARREHSYLSGGRPYLRLGGADVPLAGPALVADIDEVELTWSSAEIRIEVRHSFTAGWGVRVVISNRSDHPVEVTDAGLTWEPTAGTPAWALAAGATGTYAIFPADADGPLLGGSLRVGTFETLAADRMSFGRIQLAADGRYVVQWQWDWYPNPRAFARPGGASTSRNAGVPHRLFLVGEETAKLGVDEDAALVLPPGLGQEVVNGVTEILSGGGSSRYAVEVVSARGVTHYDLHWSEPVEDRMREAAALALAAPAAANGVPVLTDADAALAVQQALRARLVDEPYAAEDALEAFVARAAEADPSRPTPALISLLGGETERTGETDLLERATELIRAHRRPVAGLGLAATQVCVSRVIRGLEVTPVLAHLDALSQGDPGPELTDRAARLELLLVTADGEGLQLRELAALGRRLGAGLTGASVDPTAVDLLAQLAAVFALTTPAASAAVSRGWTADVAELGRRAEAEVLFRITGLPPGPALSMLLMAAQTR
jgi:hypothetical protein